jgi:hypothetical protein
MDAKKAPPAAKEEAVAIATAPPVASATASAIPTRNAKPVCDDSAGTPGTCPLPGFPAEEGGCGALPTKRCNDFKQVMKPRVAERAVACINGLGYAERCDATRLAVCGHLALMSACPDDEEESANEPPKAGSAAAVCDGIVRACGGSAVAPTMHECRATLAGMTDLGRSSMVACMQAHCSDKGLLGCEAALDVK